MFATMIFALSGVRVSIPDGMRTTVMTILSAFMVSKFTPNVLTHMQQWPISLAIVPVYVLVCLTSAPMEQINGIA